MIKLRGINFGSVFLASGALNFWGQGWPFHKPYKLLPGFNFSGATFITKTTTLGKRDGNMPLNKRLQPQEFLPDCIRVYPKKGVVLNAVGLSGPGAKALINSGKWQKIRDPFIISFMAVGDSKEERLEEIKRFSEMLKEALPAFAAKVALKLMFLALTPIMILRN